MRITLQNFESQIDEQIVDRGLSYWEDGLVINLEQTKEGIFEAVVSGTEDYDVEVITDGNTVTDFDCNCPYDRGPICKHVIAVLYAISEGNKKKTVNPKKIAKPAKIPVQKDPSEKQLTNILCGLGKDELADWITEWAKKDDKFRSLFLVRFSKPDDRIDIEKYARVLVNVNKHKGSNNRYDDFNDDIPDEEKAGELLHEMEANFSRTSVSEIISLCFAVFKVITPLLYYVDDSAGAFSGLIEEAVGLLNTAIRQKEMREPIRKETFDLCMKYYNEDGMEIDGWDFGVLEIAGDLLKGTIEKKKLFAVLDGLERSNKGNYREERSVEIRKNVIEQFEGKDASEKYMETKIHLPDVRSQFVEKAISVKNYIRAKELCNQGLISDNKFPGIVHRWNEYLLNIAQRQKDNIEVIRLAKMLFLSTFNSQQFYTTLKKFTPAEQWSETVEDLIFTLKKNRDNGYIPWIYIQEKMFNRLLAYVQKDPHPSIISEYDKYLITSFASEIADLYETTIRKLSKQGSGRKDYAECCRWLRRLRKLGEKDRVTILIKELVSANPRKPAFLDELRKV